MLTLLRDDMIDQTVDALLPAWQVDVEDDALMRLATLSARVIDYKSLFTRKHTVQIANRSWLMSWHYGFDKETRVKMYLAAALHDIGKMLTPTEVLEKPGRLDPSEFETIMRHVQYTRDLLEKVDGLGDICEWASNHHEKLDGTGYPLGKSAEDLDLPSRLMACIDIYQAVSEERPYHARRSHQESMPILYEMADRGKIDRKIVADIDAVMAPYSGYDIPDVDDYLSNMDWK
jgi:HD-GYP domain-containing protein (c-di-GMP phosphodiesterase class II)